MTSSGTATEQAYPLSTRVAIEGLGSFFIVLAGLGTAIFSSTGSGTTVGFAYGLAMAAAIISFGHISRGFFNPAFSLGMAISGRLKFMDMGLYVVAQTVGAVLASAVWLAMIKVMPTGATPDTAQLFGILANGFDDHSPSKVPFIGVLIVEVVLVAVLTAMVLGVTSVRNKTTLGPVAIGLAFAVAVGITMPLSNGSLNPARATSVVFLAEPWAASQLWLFWVAPLVGAALAAAVMRAFAPAAHADQTHDADATSPAPVAAASSAAVATDAAAGTQGADAADADTDAGAADAGAAGAGAVGAGAAPAKPVPASDDAQAFFDGPGK